jgi:hypothetical protein
VRSSTSMRSRRRNSARVGVQHDCPPRRTRVDLPHQLRPPWTSWRRPLEASPDTHSRAWRIKSNRVTPGATSCFPRTRWRNSARFAFRLNTAS